MMHSIGNSIEIGPVSEFIERACIDQITRVLDSETHALPASLKITRNSHRGAELYPPIAKHEKFNNSAVMKTIRHINSTRHSERVLHPDDKKTEPAQSGKPRTQCPTCPESFVQISKHKCKGTPI
jgi:hypothetical protein